MRVSVSGVCGELTAEMVMRFRSAVLAHHPTHVVILGGTGSLLGALVGSFLIGFLYNFGQALFPDLAYVILFLPMLLVLVLRPQGLFGRVLT